MLRPLDRNRTLWWCYDRQATSDWEHRGIAPK